MVICEISVNEIFYSKMKKNKKRSIFVNVENSNPLLILRYVQDNHCYRPE